MADNLEQSSPKTKSANSELSDRWHEEENDGYWRFRTKEAEHSISILAKADHGLSPDLEKALRTLEKSLIRHDSSPRLGQNAAAFPSPDQNGKEILTAEKTENAVTDKITVRAPAINQTADLEPLNKFCQTLMSIPPADRSTVLNAVSRDLEKAGIILEINDTNLSITAMDSDYASKMQVDLKPPFKVIAAKTIVEDHTVDADPSDHFRFLQDHIISSFGDDQSLKNEELNFLGINRKDSR
jgi:hypothetical protein